MHWAVVEQLWHFAKVVGDAGSGKGWRSLSRVDVATAHLNVMTDRVVCPCAWSLFLCNPVRHCAGDKAIAMEFLEVPCEVLYGDVERVGGEHAQCKGIRHSQQLVC
jgi:hypothetical protein